MLAGVCVWTQQRDITSQKSWPMISRAADSSRVAAANNSLVGCPNMKCNTEWER